MPYIIRLIAYTDRFVRPGIVSNSLINFTCIRPRLIFLFLFLLQLKNIQKNNLLLLLFQVQSCCLLLSGTTRNTFCKYIVIDRLNLSTDVGRQRTNIK